MDRNQKNQNDTGDRGDNTPHSHFKPARVEDFIKLNKRYNEYISRGYKEK